MSSHGGIFAYSVVVMINETIKVHLIFNADFSMIALFGRSCFKLILPVYEFSRWYICLKCSRNVHHNSSSNNQSVIFHD